MGRPAGRPQGVLTADQPALRRPDLADAHAVAGLILVAAPSIENVVGDRHTALRAAEAAFRSDRTVWGHRWALVADGDAGEPVGLLTAFPGKWYGSLALGTGVTLARAAGARHAADLTKRGRVLNALIAPVSSDVLFVSALAVRSDHRGRGLGTALLERAIAGAKELHLGVAIDAPIEDRAARRVPEGLGFKEVTVRRTAPPDRTLIPAEGLVRLELPPQT
ncbi:MAG TPA: GNAT family N-acetyltransferase [Actinomycetota bacterium]|nr:GNAT family N-acetyltransferase [Actinomycetota bacterium]